MAAVIEREARDSRSTFAKIVNDERNRSIFWQVVVFGLIGWTCWYLFSNTAANLEARGMSSGFSFLGTSAGFDWANRLFTPVDPLARRLADFDIAPLVTRLNVTGQRFLTNSAVYERGLQNVYCQQPRPS